MTAEEKKALREWEEFLRNINNDVPTEDFLSQQDIAKKRKKLEEDPIAWIKYFFPQYAKYEFAPFHVRAIKRVIAHGEWYEVLSWSRELAKSTVVMFILMYLVFTGKKHFIVCASATIDAAIRLLTPFRITFETNTRIKQFYGEQMNLGDWSEKEFTTRNGAKFLAVGAGSAPRGVRNQNVRPDVLYMDDYDTDEACRNPETLNKRWQWFEEALYPTRSISEPTLIIWCGNIIAKDCCITRAGKLADSWDVVNIRDKNGKSTWESKNTEEHIDNVLKKVSAKARQQEYFNNPVSEGKIFKNLAFGKIPPLKRFKFLVAYGDPAYSDSKSRKSSMKALVLIGKLRGVYYVIKCFLANEINARFIGWYFDIKSYVAGETTVYYYMENNKLQDPFFNQVFKPLLRDACAERKTQLHIKGDDRKKTDKAVRIEANLEPLDSNGALIFNEEEQDNPMMQELINQFKLFEMHLPYPADGCDAVEGGVGMIDVKTGELEPTYTIDIAEFNKHNPYNM